MGAQNNLHLKQYTDLDLDATAVQISTSAASTSNVTVYGLDVDNTQNTVAVFIHVWNHAGPTVGTTEAVIVYRVPAGVELSIVLNGGVGIALATGCWLAALTASKGSTAPTNDVRATVYVN